MRLASGHAYESYLDQVTRGGKTRPQRGRRHSVGWDLGLHREEEASPGQAALLSSSWLLQALAPLAHRPAWSVPSNCDPK